MEKQSFHPLHVLMVIHVQSSMKDFCLSNFWFMRVYMQNQSFYPLDVLMVIHIQSSMKYFCLCKFWFIRALYAKKKKKKNGLSYPF